MPKLTVQERCKPYRILDTDMLSDIFLNIQMRRMQQSNLNEMDVRKAADHFIQNRRQMLLQMY